MPPLLIVYHALTPNSTSIASTIVELSVFGSLAFAKKAAMGIIKVELSFFKRIAILIDPFNPFIWWVEHKQQIPNV
jgi:hypothetical protein